MKAKPVLKTKPFLKWAGGKFRLLDAILRTLPKGKRLVEPFLGSGAVFLNASYQEYLLCDCNADLIALFKGVQTEGESYIIYCKSFFTESNNSHKAFYCLRDRFNASTDSAERGALLLYLNRHAFNGLVRYNTKGYYNAPFGKYKRPYFPLTELRHCHAKTQCSSTTFLQQDFQKTFIELRSGDVVYADPPYIPLSATANFTGYAGVAFGEQEQRCLAELAEKAWKRKIPVILSNHDMPFACELYARARLQQFRVQRFISCNGAERGKAPELLAAYA